MLPIDRRTLVRASLAGAAAFAATPGFAHATPASMTQEPVPRLPLPGERTGSTIEHNGAKIFFQTFGQGEPMLLVHGYPLSGALFGRVANILAQNHTVITPDLRGYGQSTTSSVPDNVEIYAADMLALLDSLKIKKAIIGGMSMGGPTVLTMYKMAPERFSGLILIDTDAKKAQPQEMGIWNGLVEVIDQKGVTGMIPFLLPQMLTGQTRMNEKAQVAYLTEIIKQCSKDAAIGGAKALANRPDLTSVLGSVNVPTLVLVGLDDPVYPFEISKKMHEAVSGSKLHIVPGAAHAAIFEKAGDSGQAIENWAQSVRVSAH